VAATLETVLKLLRRGQDNVKIGEKAQLTMEQMSILVDF
jgi:hypothetical protein